MKPVPSRPPPVDVAVYLIESYGLFCAGLVTLLYASQEVFQKHAENHSVDVGALLTLQRECVEERAFALGIHPDHLAAALADLRLFAAESDPNTSNPLLDSVTRRRLLQPLGLAAAQISAPEPLRASARGR